MALFARRSNSGGKDLLDFKVKLSNSVLLNTSLFFAGAL